MESSPVPGDFIKFLPVCGSVYMRWQRRGGRGRTRIQKLTGEGKGGGLAHSFKLIQVSHSRIQRSEGLLDHSNAIFCIFLGYLWSII